MKTKFNLDRERLDSSYINSRQDFEKVIKGYRATKPPIWNNPWFYGPAGLAGLAIILTLTFQNNFFANGNNSTLSTSLQTPTNQLPDDTPCLTPLSSEADIRFEEFNIDPKKGGQIITSNGSVVTIPSKSLIAAEKGNVLIKVREFNDQASAFSAGVPMDYGKKSAFESGGMLEVRGEQNGKSVSIDVKKPIKVDMALHKSGENFQFWSLNDKNGDWTEYHCEFANIPIQIVPLAYPAGQTGVKLSDVEEKIEVCNDKIQTLKSDSKSQELIPTEYSRKLIIDFDAKQFPELASYKDLEFEYVHPLNQTATEMKAFEKRVQYATQTIWNTMDVSKKSGNYIVTFKNSRESYSLPVRPVLKGASLVQFEQKLKQATQDKEVKIMELEKSRETLKKEQAELKKKFNEEVSSMRTSIDNYVPTNRTDAPVRSEASKSNLAVGNASFTTSSFGIFNCDRPHPYPNPFPHDVLCKNEAGQPIRMSGAFVFDLKNNIRFSFGIITGKKIDELAWGRNNSTLIVIDEEGNLHYKQEVNKTSLNANTSITLTRLDRKDVNLNAIKKILSENSVDS